MSLSHPHCNLPIGCVLVEMQMTLAPSLTPIDSLASSLCSEDKFLLMPSSSSSAQIEILRFSCVLSQVKRMKFDELL